MQFFNDISYKFLKIVSICGGSAPRTHYKVSPAFLASGKNPDENIHCGPIDAIREGMDITPIWDCETIFHLDAMIDETNEIKEKNDSWSAVHDVKYKNLKIFQLKYTAVIKHVK